MATTTTPDPLTELSSTISSHGQQPDDGLLWNPPGGSSAVGAIARHKLLIALSAIVVAIAGIGFGVAHKPTYTAAATLQVGEVNPNSPGFYGYVQAGSSLANSFSRSITAAPVLADIQSKLGLEPTQAAARLSAEPVPLSPTFRVVASGASAKAAIALANVTGEAVISYVAHTNSTSPQATALFASYHQAATNLQRAARRVSRLESNLATKHSEAMTRAQATLDAARLHANALAAAYQSALVAAGPSSGLVSMLASAVTASNDHRSKIELLGFIGLLAGLVLGSLAAIAYEQRRAPRTS